jgi:uncharacterized membrane protein YeaQ/YmgE (transglycosylase-associated protein family)
MQAVYPEERKGGRMWILAWIMVGLIAGLVMSKIVNHTGERVVLDTTLGVVGALLGGWMFDQFGPRGLAGMSSWTPVAALTGAVVVLMGYHTTMGPSDQRI